MRRKIFLLSFAMLFNTSVLAENWYVDGGAGFITFDDGFDEISPTNLYVRGGYQFNQNFNVGLESSFTISSDQIPSDPDVDLDVNVVTLYVRGGAFVSESVWLYGQVGSSNTELTAEFAGVEFSVDDNDIMFGFGAEIDLGSKSTYLALNYSIYNDNDGVDVTAFNIGVGARF